jgi:opacity protein-like surface antigen
LALQRKVRNHKEVDVQYARIALFAAFAIGSNLAQRVYAAGDPLGLYVGAGLGQSEVRVDGSVFDGPSGFDAHRDAWKLLVGLRPTALFGAELDYLDFGHARFAGPPNAFGSALRADSHPKASALFGILYAPIPVPLLDVYAKAGIARLQTSVNANVYCAVSPCVVTAVAPIALRRTDAEFAYGAGVQFRFAAFAARLEYERINASTGDPDLTSFGITWSF